MIPHACPICSGTTNVPAGFYNTCPGGSTVSDHSFDKCKACVNGIVWENISSMVIQTLPSSSGSGICKEIYYHPEGSSILGGTTEILKKILKAIQGLGKKV